MSAHTDCIDLQRFCKRAPAEYRPDAPITLVMAAPKRTQGRVAHAKQVGTEMWKACCSLLRSSRR